MRAPFSRLYPILDASLETLDSLSLGVRALARAGCRLIQLRAKDLLDDEFHRWALAARAASREAGAKLLINDRVDVALLSGADGVHLGHEDLSPEAAREILGESAIIGLSTHGVDEARLAARAPVDYVAIGPIFETSTKTSGRSTLGVEGARAVRAVVAKPLVAIGGITVSNAPALFEAGVDGVAVISALKTGDIEAIARRFLAM
ncbi:MAG TPA: thiamine phosphate synthase [Vicinamibacteria bacterium]|nr:thiamine phosphate synthase [Vicinamibacteria bacterium]